jgi:hypothetical protein
MMSLRSRRSSWLRNVPPWVESQASALCRMHGIVTLFEGSSRTRHSAPAWGALRSRWRRRAPAGRGWSIGGMGVKLLRVLGYTRVAAAWEVSARASGGRHPGCGEGIAARSPARCRVLSATPHTDGKKKEVGDCVGRTRSVPAWGAEKKFAAVKGGRQEGARASAASVAEAHRAGARTTATDAAARDQWAMTYGGRASGTGAAGWAMGCGALRVGVDKGLGERLGPAAKCATSVR